MSRYFSRGFQIFVDLFVLSAAYWLAFLLRFEFNPTLEVYKLLFFTWPYIVILQYLILVIFGVPRFSWRYVGTHEAGRIMIALSASTLVLVILRLVLAPVGSYSKFVVIPLGILLMDFVIAAMGIGGARFARRMLYEKRERSRRKPSIAERKRTFLIGAGRAGVMVSKEVKQNPNLRMDIVGFIDDDQVKVGAMIQGHKVVGDIASLGELARRYRAEQAIITIAAASGGSIRRIVRACEESRLPVKIIPGIHEILSGKVNLSRIREVTIEDLLGREAVELDTISIGTFISGKRVLITGAGGSIGSELCRQVSRFSPERIILLEQAENALFEIHRELQKDHHDLDIVPYLADICDVRHMDKVFTCYGPHIVFHAAAHKHVPMMETNPGEAVKNNVFGTKNVADAADRHGTAVFVLVSTDKAVNPTSIMGATKRVAEIYIQAMDRRSETRFSAVRFGNVLGSAGSVIPIFKQQIQRGGPVTVTHTKMKRYFMTIPEACQLVMQAAAMGKGGEIFVLDMGEPVKILDLARDLIRLSGFTEEEIPVEFTGVRPGEKLFEELYTTGENMERTQHPKIFIGKIQPHDYKSVSDSLNVLDPVIDSISREEVSSALRKVVPEMRSPDAPDDIHERDRRSTSSQMIH